LFEFCVVLRAQKGEWRGKRSRTNASDEAKDRTIAASAPAIQKSRTESSIVTATRYCEKVSGRQFAMVGSYCSFVGLEAKRRQALPVCIGVVPSVGYIDADLGRHHKWNRRQAISARTSND
jgi:hypothetical protein